MPIVEKCTSDVLVHIARIFCPTMEWTANATLKASHKHDRFPVKATFSKRGGGGETKNRSAEQMVRKERRRP